MSFYLGDLLVDRAINGVAENSKGELLYNLTNLQSLNINITADSTDAVDGTGSIIKTFYRGKQGELTATNSTLSLPIVNAMSGNDEVDYASADNAIVMPRIVTGAKAQSTDATATISLPGLATTDTAATAKIVVNSVAPNGALGAAYTLGTAAAAGKFTFTPATAASGDTPATDASITITPIADSGDAQWIVKYDRTVKENGAKIINRSDLFPKSVKLTIKVLIVDPCETDVVRACYLVIPNFQPSPEVSIDFATDATLDYTGRLQTAYCGAEKLLYEIYICADDIEED